MQQTNPKAMAFVGLAVQQQHECCHRCQVTHEFGNLFKCHSSGMLHVCDDNCDQRLWHDRYSTICRVSKRLFPPFECVDMDATPAGRWVHDEGMQDLGTEPKHAACAWHPSHGPDMQPGARVGNLSSTCVMT